MTPKSTYFRLMCLVTIAAFLSACTTFHPNHMSTISEAFPPEQLAGNYSQDGFHETRTFKAPYATIYRASRVSTAQSQFLIKHADENKGIILAENQFYTGGNLNKNYFGIKIKELGPETTQVSIYAKSQGACSYPSNAFHALMTVFTLGLWLLFLPSLIPAERENCNRASKLGPGWLRAPEGTSVNPLQQFMVFVENNLLASGDI